MVDLADGIWKGRRCFILGGGPSLRSVPAEFVAKLKSELTIGVNGAFLFDPTIAFAQDVAFQDGIGSSEQYELCRSIKVFSCVMSSRVDKKWPGVEHLASCGRRWSSSLAEGVGWFSNSGLAALHLADLLGADPIYLLGFDLHEKDGRTVNWHDLYETHGSDRIYRKFKSEFEGHAKNVRARVVNLNPDSALTCFEKMPLSDVVFKPRPTFMTYATPSYFSESIKLQRSARIFGLTVRSHVVTDAGDWKVNVRQKPHEIKKAWEKCGDGGLVYLDADARIIRYPHVFESIRADFAAHLSQRREGAEVLACGGTLFFAKTDRAGRFIDKWIQCLDETTSDPRGDMDALKLALMHEVEATEPELRRMMIRTENKRHDGFEFQQLPPEYLWIFDLMPQLFPGRWPVILHTQASRRMKGEATP